MRIDAGSQGLVRTESVAERADAYGVALRLLEQRQWAEGVTPHDALRLAMFLTEGLEDASAEYEDAQSREAAGDE